MKRALLPLLLSLPVIYIGGCSSEDNPITVPGVSGSGTVGTAGSGATGGSSPGASGSGTGTSGSAAQAGSTGTAGSAVGGSGTGGVAGSSSGGMAGAVTGGTGGAAGGSTGGGGTGGVAATPVSVGKLDGMLVMSPCGEENPNVDDCSGGGIIYEGKTTTCSGGRLDSDIDKTMLDFPVTGGEKGKRYLATMHFYGIMEPKNYGNSVTREAGATRPNAMANPSVPEGFATAEGGANIAITDYNNYEIHSFDDTGKEIKQYFINSDLQQGHWTFAINYERPIEVVSGGKVHVRIYDNNCRQIKNCSGGPPCNDAKARRIDLTGATTQPVGLNQPGLGKNVSSSGQWFFIDVKDIVPKP